MRVRKLLDSFNYAFEGIIYALKTQRNMKIHFIVTVFVLVASLFFNFSKVEIILLLLTITLVLIAEMINTSIESTIDLITDQYNIFAKIAKNVAAGAVLIAALNAVVVAYLIFFHRLNPYTHMVLTRVRQSPIHITFIAFLVVIFITIGLKAYFGKGTAMQGGMPSGHAAISFALATSITFISENMFIGTLSLLMALLVCQSRIETRIHNVYEILVGAVIGIIVTVIFFQFFS
ncbi:diacylglycerol kinase [Serpentinicella alkaliphila]|uniref:Diacylglycerol kinase (ATP) n=1 Tax=Serpentinicella alkaliphila TaxID=1734049 RepID=A0A4R2UK00_9FIRM|nr:diacylglycerol kinase [Serpentinicella alkaliphila]QUH26900.1 diacylglycerol kinase [Serpentinicella alkaliphila]TCQ08133.1 diacylglycerol kinase (ATP) [Serpentinicella alkaliphila]